MDPHGWAGNSGGCGRSCGGYDAENMTHCVAMCSCRLPPYNGSNACSSAQLSFAQPQEAREGPSYRPETQSNRRLRVYTAHYCALAKLGHVKHMQGCVGYLFTMNGEQRPLPSPAPNIALGAYEELNQST